MVSFPHCKINLGLNVVSKRPDGYHDIESCFYPVPLTDILEIIPSIDFSFTQSGLNVPGIRDDNLCVKAYTLLKKEFGVKEVKIHLHKIVPMGAGLGGGSSDGAFVLRLLNSIFDLRLAVDQQRKYAIQLGSDCSFFLQDVPMVGKGRGELLSSATVNLNGYFLVLARPDVYVSTAEAYKGITPQRPETPLEEILKLPVDRWRHDLKNDFEPSIFKKFPVIGQLKEKMYSVGALYASMSGSGSTVFGIFERSIDLKKHFQDLFYWSGELK
jgi:4-diphosphocytidyl-2-C-methyl-D-erythritol kinase